MKLLERCAIVVASSPRKYILWPAMMAFVLSYTTLYSLFSPALPYAPVPQCIDPTISEPELYIRQALVCPPEFTDAMDNDILQGLTGLKELDQYGLLVSPLNIGVTSTSSSSVLYAPKLDSQQKLSTAKGLLISFIYKNQTQGDEVWLDKLRHLVRSNKILEKQYNSSTIFPSAANYDKDSLPSDFNFFPNCPLPLFSIILIYSAGALYMGMVFSDTESVLSQAGLAITLAVETTLAVFAALTTTSFFFPSFSHHNLRPFFALPYIVAAVATTNMFRLVDAISKTPPENNPLSRISAAVSIAAPVSIRKSLTDCGFLVIGLVPGLGLSQNAKALCLFMILGLIFDLCLHLTFFTAVLSVDLRRLELQDLISASATSPPMSPQIKGMDIDSASGLNDHNREESNWTKTLRLQFKAFVYFRRIYLRQKLPELTAMLIYGTILGYLWLLSNGYISQPQAMTNPSGMFTYFLSPLSSRLTEMNKGNILVYEPIVLYARLNKKKSAVFDLGMPLHGALTPTISDFFAMNLMVEFISSLVFIVSLTALVLKFVLPTSIEIPDISLNEYVKFFSKDLVGYHTLDILQLVIQGSWVGTVSLDHKVHVWNAALSKSKDLKPISIPCDVWPINKLAMSYNKIAIFSPNNVLVWNFKTKSKVLEVNDIGQAVEAYFSDDELVVVTPNTLYSFGTTVEKMNLPNITLATRLLTPKLHDQVVCVSKSNQLFIVTKNENWEIKPLNLVESITAMSRAERMPYLSQLEPQKRRVPGPIDTEHIVMSRPIEFKEPLICIVPIPELHMVLVASQFTCSFLNISTGTILSHIQIGNFKKGTLRVFHSQPTYCRFCGSMSIESMSVAYSDADNDGLVICHSLTIENRARSNICLRAERDPRETRCLGFEATTEDQHWIGNVEGWDTTAMNMIMGVRRKEQESPTPDSDSNSNWSTSTSVLLSITTTETRRKRQKKPPLNITWEGWAMSANGQVTYYDIPDLQNNGKNSAFSTRLLIQSIGPVIKYGRKSIAVAFGNVIKILYFGNEESFLFDETETDLATAASKHHRSKWKRGY